MFYDRAWLTNDFPPRCTHHEIGRMAPLYMGKQTASQHKLPLAGGIFDPASHQTWENAGLAGDQQLFSPRYLLEWCRDRSVAADPSWVWRRLRSPRDRLPGNHTRKSNHWCFPHQAVARYLQSPDFRPLYFNPCLCASVVNPFLCSWNRKRPI